LTATRRDLDDPAVIAEVANTVQDLQLLQLLYLLTVADSRATGPTMWSDWKATLVRSLFVRCAARFGAAAPLERGTTREEVLAAVTPGRVPDLQAHLDAMPSDYLRSSMVEDVLWHMDLISTMDGATNFGTRSAAPVETAVVVGRSMPGFHRRVAEAFAANGIDVLEARLFRRDDGLILDSFQVRDDRTGGQVRAERWDSWRGDIEAVFIGEIDIGSKVALRAAAYDRPAGERAIVRGSVDAATGDLVLTVKCTDRIGRLAEILTALGDCGLEIRLAKIDSRQGEVIDTFHVTGVVAKPVDVSGLEDRLATAISP
jgi:[protein-PII] uridylyltransferase